MVRQDMRINHLLNGRSFEQVSLVELRPQAEVDSSVDREEADKQITSSSIRYPILRRPSKPRKRLCHSSRWGGRCCIRNCKSQPGSNRKSKSGEGGITEGLKLFLFFFHWTVLSFHCSFFLIPRTFGGCIL
jgi:hypothetical protein